MSNHPTETPQEVDPLSGAAAGFKAPEYPVLAADRLCDFEVSKASKESIKEDKDKPNPRQMLVLTLKTTKDYTDKNGKPLRAGFTVFKRIGLYEMVGQPDKRDRTMAGQIGPELAQVLVSCGMGSRAPRDLYNDPSIVVKSQVKMKTSIIPAKDGFAESNGVTFVPLA